MSNTPADHPAWKLRVRLSIQTDSPDSTVSSKVEHLCGVIFDIINRIQRKCAAGGTYEHDDVTAEAIKDLHIWFIRKLMMLGCLSQDINGQYAGAKHVIPFSGRIKMVPSVMFPLPFPRSLFIDCINYNPLMTRLIDTVSCNVTWLCRELEQLRSHDPFMSGLLDICNEVYLSGKRSLHSDIRAYITRTDYFMNVKRDSGLNEPSYSRISHCDISAMSESAEMKLVEVNTVSCAMAHLVGLVSRAQNELLRYLIDRDFAAATPGDEAPMLSPGTITALDQHNSPQEGIVDTLAAAHRSYAEIHCGPGDRSPCVMEVVTEDLSNFFDVYAVADQLFSRHGIRTKVMSINALCALYRGSGIYLLGHDGALVPVKSKSDLRPGRLFIREPSLINGAVANGYRDLTEVSVIYFRSCYSQDHMESDPDSWLARLICEYSDAVKVPSVPAQLAGSKRVQMLLCNPGIETQLSELVTPNDRYSLKEALAMFRSVNVQQVDPSLPGNREVVQEAILKPENFVLKSQAEGGAELYVNNELASILSEGIKDDCAKMAHYVLMRRITPPVQRAVFVKNNIEGSYDLTVERCLTELGIYGGTVFRGEHVVTEECCGYLARTKNETTAGGGVCSGCSAVNSLLFY
ncbi:Eukaryotic glutathione synthase ATP binding domain family protein [Babesia bovis T2Bo]|uniref:Glutathione synthetase n=1 Tax=Babesia bovis TaxID=5865 RepID=A7AQM4_BABBO|nr:Eukaryotic glutathione synthase ATP binding domain family protein [Babesia bovis T2Bo]EDO06843.1 Eukaryotic glutathione synthase ATP binding domain family protein [Babesia bovis T2Bo]|eukprot:XP_001610411.1 glutathione synthase [Babesia bovis T2Bo]